MPSIPKARLPPISSVRRLQIAKPQPVPPYLRVVELSACVKDLNSNEMRSSGMPMPVSLTMN